MASNTAQGFQVNKNGGMGMILKYTALIFLVFGAMIFAAYCIPIGASDQATPDDWKTPLLNSAGKDVDINARIEAGLIDENTLLESGLVDETPKAIDSNLAVSSKNLGELGDNNSSGNFILNAALNNNSATDITREILNNTNATEITQYIADMKSGN